jgi:hypothetical protein
MGKYPPGWGKEEEVEENVEMADVDVPEGLIYDTDSEVEDQYSRKSSPKSSRSTSVSTSASSRSGSE